jgi:hypothetical protein
LIVELPKAFANSWILIVQYLFPLLQFSVPISKTGHTFETASFFPDEANKDHAVAHEISWEHPAFRGSIPLWDRQPRAVGCWFILRAACQRTHTRHQQCRYHRRDPEGSSHLDVFSSYSRV